ncbi:Ja28 [Japanese cytomegalovirus]|nr:Ja28 [Japanese cytomegalovirus]
MNIYIRRYLGEWNITMLLVQTCVQSTEPCTNTYSINVTANDNVVLNATRAMESCFIFWFKNPAESMCQYNASHAMKASAYTGRLNFTCTNYTLTIFNADSSASGMYYTIGAHDLYCIREKICYKVKVQSTLKHESLVTQISPPLRISPSMSESTIIWYIFVSSGLVIIILYLAKNAHSYWKHGHYYVPQIWWIQVDVPEAYRSMVS